MVADVGRMRGERDCRTDAAAPNVFGTRETEPQFLAAFVLRSPQHALNKKLRRLLPRPFRRGEGLLAVVYPPILSVKPGRSAEKAAGKCFG